MEINEFLFHVINSLAGKNTVLDLTGIFLAKYTPFFFIVFLLYLCLRGKKKPTICAGYSAILGILLNFIIGLFYFHPRPFMEGLGKELIKHSPDNSFPSDHTTFMLSIALTLFYFKETRIWGIFLSILGLLGGLSRVYCGVHFPFDILGSVFVSLVSSTTVYFLKDYLEPLNKIIEGVCDAIFRRKKTVVPALFLITSISTTSLSADFKYYSRVYAEDLSYSVKQVGKRKREFLIFGALLGASFAADRGVRSYFKKHRTRFYRHYANFSNNFGYGYFMFPGASLLAAYGYYTEDSKLLNASLTSIESGITAGLITEVIKSSIGRERPYGTNDPFKFKPFKGGELYHSFPSGHSVIAWSMITPFAVYYSEPILYAIPISVNFARIYKNKHWLSDTVFSSGLGFAVGYFFSERHLKRRLFFEFTGNSVSVGYRF